MASRRIRGGAATCWLGYAVIGLSGNVLGPVLPVLRHDLHAGYGALSLLFVAGSIGSAAAAMFGNRLLDRVGYRRLLALAGLALGVACLGRAFLPSFWLWLALSLVAGFAGSGIDIGGIRYVTAQVSERRNVALNLLNVFYSVGAVLAPFAVGALAALGAGVLWAYVVSAACVLAMAGAALVTLPAGALAGKSTDAFAAWRWALGRPVLVRLAAAIALYAGLEVAFVGWAASYAHAREHLGVALSALFPLVFWAAMSLGRALSTERARHWSEGTLAALGTGLAMAGGVLALGGSGPLPVAAGVALVGLGCAPIWPSLFAVAAHASPDRHSEAYGLLFPASSAGGLVAPWLAGELFGAVGPRAALAVPVACAVALGGLLWWVLARDVGPGGASARVVPVDA